MAMNRVYISNRGYANCRNVGGGGGGGALLYGAIDQLYIRSG